MKKKKFHISSVFLYLVLSAWAVTTIYPIIWVVQNSFKAKDKIISQSFAMPFGDLFTLANYRKAFGNMNILGAYKNSFIISGTVAVVVLILAGLAAFALVRFDFKLKKTLYSLVIAAMMIPSFATIIPVMRMEAGWGIVNTSKVSLSLISCILPQIAGNLAFAIVVLKGYIEGLPVELEESAFLEGCTVPQIFVKIVVPLTKPSFATVAIFSFLWSYNDLFNQMFFLRNQKQWAITMLLNQISSNEGTNYGLMAAAVTLVVVPVVILYVFLQKYIIKGMTAGAIKG